MSQPTAEQDEQQIRALIDAWCEASAAGDLATQFNLMTHDVVFLTSAARRCAARSSPPIFAP
jgi:uncharacterized protein (TIGR02246 family)